MNIKFNRYFFISIFIYFISFFFIFSNDAKAFEENGGCEIKNKTLSISSNADLTCIDLKIEGKSEAVSEFIKISDRSRSKIIATDDIKFGKSTGTTEFNILFSLLY